MSLSGDKDMGKPFPVLAVTRQHGSRSIISPWESTNVADLPQYPSQLDDHSNGTPGNSGSHLRRGRVSREDCYMRRSEEVPALIVEAGEGTLHRPDMAGREVIQTEEERYTAGGKDGGNLERKLQRMQTEPPKVSEGFWKSMRLTPGEATLRNNRQRLSRSSQMSDRPTRSEKKENHMDGSLKRLVTGHQHADDATDPDRIKMSQILSILSSRNQQYITSKNGASPRDTMTSSQGGRPMTTVEMALRSSRRYRHPEKDSLLAQRSQRSSQPTASTHIPYTDGCWACHSTAVELALKHKSVTYTLNQRSKKNREASVDGMRVFRERDIQTPMIRSYTLDTLRQSGRGGAAHSDMGTSWGRASTFYRLSLDNATRGGSSDRKASYSSSQNGSTPQSEHSACETVQLPSIQTEAPHQNGGEHSARSFCDNNVDGAVDEGIDEAVIAPCNSPTCSIESELSTENTID